MLRVASHHSTFFFFFSYIFLCPLTKLFFTFSSINIWYIFHPFSSEAILRFQPGLDYTITHDLCVRHEGIKPLKMVKKKLKKLLWYPFCTFIFDPRSAAILARRKIHVRVCVCVYVCTCIRSKGFFFFFFSLFRRFEFHVQQCLLFIMT